MTELADDLKQPMAQLLLSIADDKLMRGHRNSDWTGLGPILEEDIAFSSLAQDNIAHAQAIYETAGGLLGATADALAFGRTPDDYRCAAIVELPDEFDYAVAIARQFYCSHFDLLRLQRLANSSWKPVADLAKRLAAEEQVQVEHVDGWIRRLGAGTDDSAQRIQAALDALGAPAVALFEPTDGVDALESAGAYPRRGDMFDAWADALSDVTGDAGLRLDLARPDGDARGGRRGAHSAHLAPMLDEMCEVYRLEPGAAW